VATAHLIHGYLGAGKTSFAAHLEQAVGGMRLSADEWYLRLYSGDEPAPHLEPAWWDRVSSLLAVGAETRLYAVVCSDEVARTRCLARNADPGASFVIDAEAFDALRAKFEPVEPDEAFELVDTTNSRR
jgi:hypothetical protein